MFVFTWLSSRQGSYRWLCRSKGELSLDFPAYGGHLPSKDKSYTHTHTPGRSLASIRQSEPIKNAKLL